MAKQKVTDKIQARFMKPQFQIGAVVLFSWLGQKKQGYVKKHKNTGWGVQYMVTSLEGTNYPCGIQIEGHKTNYNTGFIFYEETKSLDPKRSSRRTKTDDVAGETADVPGIAGGSTYQSRNDDSIQRGDVAETSITPSIGTQHGHEHDALPSPNRVRGGNTKKRKDTTKSSLDTAVQRQRDFLNGFIKK